MICQDCGEEMEEDAKFCIQCGYPVLGTETEAKVKIKLEPPSVKEEQ